MGDSEESFERWRKPRVYVLKIAADSSISDVATVDGWEPVTLKWGVESPLTPPQNDVLQKHAQETASFGTTSRVTLEGCPPIILLHEESFSDGTWRRELTLQLVRLSDFGGVTTFNERISGTIHDTVLQALLRVKAEQHCIRDSLGNDTIEDIRKYVEPMKGKELSGKMICASDDYALKSNVIQCVLGRYIFLSFLNLGDRDGEREDLLRRLMNVLIEVSNPEGRFGNDRVFLNIDPKWDVRGDVNLEPNGLPSEEHGKIADSVNRIVNNIVRREPPQELLSLAFGMEAVLIR